MQPESNNQKPLTKGSILDGYKIVKLLGKGGFGLTYIALNTKANKPVVIKEYFPDALALRSGAESQVSIISSDKKNDFAQGLKRFKREAMTLSEFNHPNIVKVLTLFEANNTAYFVMEHIEGQSLGDELKQRKRSFTEQEIIQECLPILQGLAEVHKKGILHLDIKPDNILRTKYGEPMLIDFGGARVTTSQGSKALSQHSSMVATDGYAPTEQYSLVTDQTAATDIYAFGMTLYKLMAPKKELPKSNDRQDSVFQDFPDPLKSIREVAKGYSDALYQVVEACTQLRQKERPQSVAQLQKLLLQLHKEESQQQAAASKPNKEPAASKPTPSPQPKPAKHKAKPQAIPEPKPQAASTPAQPSSKDPKSSKKLWVLALLLVSSVAIAGYWQYDQQQAEQESQDAAAPLAGEMVAIPAGCYQMGDHHGAGESDEKPVHKVCLSAFELGKYEVTVGSYGAFAAETGHKGTSCRYWTGIEWQTDKNKSWRNPGYSQTDRDPVACVSWQDAQAFIKWLNRKTGETYRLPTEAEWEYAARAGTKTKYSYGNEKNKLCEYGNGADKTYSKSYPEDGGVNKLCSDGYTHTAPVGSFKPNAWGLHDMHGNVWEWMQDWYGENYYRNSPANNPTGASSGRARVYRGGSWYNDARGLRSANRSDGSPDGRDDNIGFRLVRKP